MKNLLYALVLLFGFISYTQNEILMEHVWELEYVELDGEALYQPENEESDNVITIEFANNLVQSTLICNSFLANSFNVVDGNTFIASLFSDTLADCILQQNRDFEANYKSVFFTPNLVDLSPFSYSFLIQENLIYLYVTNVEGNSAIFSATNLSDVNFKEPKFSIYPNPVTNRLYIDESNDAKIQKVEIFSLNGKRVLALNYQNNQNIEVSNLENGIYFLKIYTENRSFMRSLLKN